MRFPRDTRCDLGLGLVIFSFLLASCSPTQVFYADTFTRLAAPELLEAWNRPWFGNDRQLVALEAGDLTAQVTKDLTSRNPLPKVILLPPGIVDSSVEGWKRTFPGVRFLRFRSGSTPYWAQLLARAAGGRKNGSAAVALVKPTLPEATRQLLAKQWSDLTGGGKLDILVFEQMTPTEISALETRLKTGDLDLFVLNGQTAGVMTIPATALLNVHSVLSAAYLSSFSGSSLVPDAVGLANNLDHAAADPDAIWVESAWKVIERTP